MTSLKRNLRKALSFLTGKSIIFPNSLKHCKQQSKEDWLKSSQMSLRPLKTDSPQRTSPCNLESFNRKSIAKTLKNKRVMKIILTTMRMMIHSKGRRQEMPSFFTMNLRTKLQMTAELITKWKPYKILKRLK